MKRIEFVAITPFPIIMQGEDVAQKIIDQLSINSFSVEENDIFIIASKIISVSENSIVDLCKIFPSKEAHRIANISGRSPEECQIYLDESDEIIEIVGRNVVVRHKKGFVCTSAGIDKSNVSRGLVALLPKDADKSATEIRKRIEQAVHKNISVIICDTIGRPDRHGSISAAIGISGIMALETAKQVDLFGRPTSPKIALVDRIASAASILMGESDESCPVVVARNIKYTRDECSTIHTLLK